MLFSQTTIMKNKKVILFDNLSGGHHETYMLSYAKRLLELGNKVLVFYPDITIFSTLNKQFGTQIKICKINILVNPPFFKNKLLLLLSNALNTVLLWLKAKHVIKKGLRQMEENEPDLIMFLWIDSFLNPYLRSWIIDLFFRFKWTGLYFHPRHLRSQNRRYGKVSKPDSIFKSDLCQFIMTLDENITSKLSSNTNKTVYVLPDITDETTLLDERTKKDVLSLARSRKIIGLLGVISKRKGLLSFIETIKKADVNRYFFIIAGTLSLTDYNIEQTEVIDSFFKNSHSNCLFILNKIEDGAGFNTLVESCDILFTAYELFFHSSNILTKAALFNRFVIVNDGYLMAERVKKFQTGIAIKQGNDVEILNAIESLSQGKGVDGNKLKPNFEGYFSEHSQKKLGNTLSEINI